MSDLVAFGDRVGFGYGRRRVFEGLSFEIGPGITGLLGPNGAGKSTLMSLISTRRRPTSGGLHVLGRDVADVAGRREIRQRVGLLAQRYPLVGSMQVVDTVAYAAWTHGLSQSRSYRAAETTLEQLGVAELAGRRVRSLSGGQRQRVGLATAMVHRPDLLILDEPTAGLDPEVRMAMRRTLRKVSGESSILLSTHLVDDVLAICDSIMVLDQGRLVFHGSAEALECHARDADHDRSDRDVGGSAMERGYEALLIEGRARAS